MMLVFSEYAKKWDVKEKEKMRERDEKQRLQKSSTHRVVRGTKYRKEIWIKPEGGRRYLTLSVTLFLFPTSFYYQFRLHRTTSAREGNTDSDESTESLKNISTSDLNRLNFFSNLICSNDRLF